VHFLTQNTNSSNAIEIKYLKAAIYCVFMKNEEKNETLLRFGSYHEFEEQTVGERPHR